MTGVVLRDIVVGLLVTGYVFGVREVVVTTAVVVVVVIKPQFCALLLVSLAHVKSEVTSAIAQNSEVVRRLTRVGFFHLVPVDAWQLSNCF